MTVVIFFFVLGLIFGSFLNVVSLRYNPEKSLLDFRNLSGRSHCPRCNKELSWYELIPVFSFLIQLGKCRSCGTKISWQYPLVELASGFIFLLPLYLYNPLIPNILFIIQSIVWILAFLIFLLIWTIDFRLYLIPDELSIFLALLGLGLTAARDFFNQFGEFQGSFLGGYAALFGIRQNIWLNHFFASLVGILIVGFIIFLSRGRGMGMGDLKLMAALGFLFGWPDILFIFMFASIVGGAVSLLLLLGGRKKMKSLVPFGPFLIAGIALLFFFGEEILRNYFQLIVE